MAFYKHVVTSANGLKTNDVIEDWGHMRSPSLSRRHWWDDVFSL